MSTAQTTERAFLENVASRYEAEGFDVFIQPSPSVLPPFLRECRPDAVAMSKDKNIAIEIVRPDVAASNRTQRLQQLLAGRRDWEAVVLQISAGPGTETVEVAAPDAIRRAAAEVI